MAAAAATGYAGSCIIEERRPVSPEESWNRAWSLGLGGRATPPGRVEHHARQEQPKFPRPLGVYAYWVGTRFDSRKCTLEGLPQWAKRKIRAECGIERMAELGQRRHRVGQELRALRAGAVPASLTVRRKCWIQLEHDS